MASAPSATSLLIWDFFFLASFSSSFLLTVTQTAKKSCKSWRKRCCGALAQRGVCVPEAVAEPKMETQRGRGGTAAELSP